jgi:hypothetical protein
MDELITMISQKAGISAEQAHKAIEAVKDFVKEKFPMMAGAVDNLFVAEAEEHDPLATTAGATTVVPDPSAPELHKESFLDKISDFIPGEAGQKVEDFVKGAAHKTGDALEGAKDKLGDLFGGSKK